MNLSMSETESTNVFGTFTTAVKDAAEQRARADLLQSQLTELQVKVAKAERDLVTANDNYAYLRSDMKDAQAANSSNLSSLRSVNDELSKLRVKHTQLQAELEEAKKAKPKFTKAQEADFKKALRESAAAQLESVLSPLLKGEKIAAIKVVRELTGLGLTEAKDLVEVGKVAKSVPSNAEKVLVGKPAAFVSRY